MSIPCFDHLLFDGDVLCHRAGAISEIAWHSVLESDGEVYLQFRHVKRAKAYIAEHPGTSLIEEPEALPFETARFALESMIQKALVNVKAANYTIYLSNRQRNVNFRYEVDAEYKANRRKYRKPLHYQALRDYLERKHPCKIADIGEADDALGMDQTAYLQSNKQSCIASIDKDLLMIPGGHYNINDGSLQLAGDPGELKIINRPSGKRDLKGCGFKWFAAQLLLGDAVDNIIGIKGMGAIRVYELLNDLSRLDHMIDKVKEVYAKNGRLADFDKNQKLLWILRYPEEARLGCPYIQRYEELNEKNS